MIEHEVNDEIVEQERSPRRPAPTADDIERRFAHPAVRVARPVLGAALTAIAMPLRFGWRAEGREHLAALDLPVIFAANHCSHADTAAVLSVLPRSLRNRTSVAAALDVFGPNDKKMIHALPNAALQFCVASTFHAFAFDRQGSPLRSIRTATTLVRRGWSLLIFPEGTRSRNGELASFKSGIGLMAKFTGRSVVPVRVDGGDVVLPCGKFWPRPGVINVRFGRPMLYGDCDDPAVFAARVRDEVVRMRPSEMSDAAPVNGKPAAAR